MSSPSKTTRSSLCINVRKVRRIASLYVMCTISRSVGVHRGGYTGIREIGVPDLRLSRIVWFGRREVAAAKNHVGVIAVGNGHTFGHTEALQRGWIQFD